MAESLPERRRWPASLRWALEELSQDGSGAYCRSSAAEFAERRDFPLLVLLRDTREIVGGSGLHDPDWSVPSFEIGWWGHTVCTGRGFVGEAAAAILRWGFEELGARRIFAAVDEDNGPSCRICERIGMDMESILRNARANPDGGLRHFRLYAAIT